MSIQQPERNLDSAGKGTLEASVRPARLELSTYYGLASSLDGAASYGAPSTTEESVVAPDNSRRKEVNSPGPSKQLVQQVLERASVSELLTQAQSLQTEAQASETSLQRAAIRLFEDYDDAARWCLTQADTLAELRRSLYGSQRSLETATSQCMDFVSHSADLQSQLDLMEAKLRILQIIRVAGAAVPEFQAQLAEDKHDIVVQQYGQLQETLHQLGGAHVLFERLSTQLRQEIGDVLERQLQKWLEDHVQGYLALALVPEPSTEVLASAAATAAKAFQAAKDTDIALARVHGGQRVSFVHRVRVLLEQGFQVQASVPAHSWEGLIRHLVVPLYALVQESDSMATIQVSSWAPVWQQMIGQTWLADPSPSAVQAVQAAVSWMPPDWRSVHAPALQPILEQVWAELLTRAVLPLWKECLILFADNRWTPQTYACLQSHMKELLNILEQKLHEASESLNALLNQQYDQPRSKSTRSASPAPTNSSEPASPGAQEVAATGLRAVLTSFGREVWSCIEQGASIPVAFLILSSLGERFLLESHTVRALADTYLRLRILQAIRQFQGRDPDSTVLSELSEQLTQEAALASFLVAASKQHRGRGRPTTATKREAPAYSRYTDQVQRGVVAQLRHWRSLALVCLQ